MTRRALLVGTAVLLWGPAGAVAQAAQTRRTADSPPSLASPAAGTKKAPSDPPLGAGSGANTVGPEEEASASAPPSGGDALAGNGLNSPLCRDTTEADLSGTAARNCRMSGFEAARAPTGDYAFDVHINTGATKWGNDEAATVQNLLQFGWTMLVAVVRGVIVTVVKLNL